MSYKTVKLLRFDHKKLFSDWPSDFPPSSDLALCSNFCGLQVLFLPLSKVILQFFIKGFSSNKPLIWRINVLWGSCIIVFVWSQYDGGNIEWNVKKWVGSTQGEGGLYKKLQIPTLPPKSQMSGVTFHCCHTNFECSSCCRQ